GDTIVCLHSAAGLYLTEAHARLAARFRVVAIEVPGFGTSPANTRTQTVRDLAGTMLAALDALGIAHFHLAGHSFGGRLALWMAIARPSAVRSLTLIAAAVLPSGRPPPEPAADDHIAV